jgi:hypothetical protein
MTRFMHFPLFLGFLGFWFRGLGVRGGRPISFQTAEPHKLRASAVYALFA